MNYLADLHIHSPFSRATSKTSNLAGLFAWARVKGLHLIGTGDFTHPGWFAQLRQQLAPAEPGLFRLRDERVAPALEGATPEAIEVRFLLSAEISSIYKRHGQVRKVHNIIYVPDFEAAARINSKLAAIGNIEADGRPILGLDSRDLLEIVLEQAPEGFLVPAHIWTPWFSLFGSKSGFDTVEECFGDLAGHIFALETGLSSDPDMNRLVSALDRFALISNSDCHSPAKLGREANLFATDFNFFALRQALAEPAGGGLLGTVEFFPEEGKYHLDGHRKCGVSLEPHETRRLQAVCPSCHRPLTVGVLHRVLALADREKPCHPAGVPQAHSLIPLPEVLGEILGAGPATKTVLAHYGQVINRFGSEFNFYLQTPLEEIERNSPVLAEAVRRIRRSQVIRQAGFDGEFGVIRVFAEGELAGLRGQKALFSGPSSGKKADEPFPRCQLALVPSSAAAAGISADPPAGNAAGGLNPEQQQVAASDASAIMVTAGPGTGKTHTLIERLRRLMAANEAEAARFVAITFTNRAAGEIRERLHRQIGPTAEKAFVGTFHRFCLEWLRRAQPDLLVIDEECREILLRNLFSGLARRERTALAAELIGYFEKLSGSEPMAAPAANIARYLEELTRRQAIDLEAVIPFFLRRLNAEPNFRRQVCAAVRYLFMDEFQDLNSCQYELVLVLAEKADVFAIGDPDQAIYGFRGSNLRFFFEFGRRPGTECLTLTRNYRSAPAILEAAGAVIRHNSLHGGAVLIPQRRERIAIEHFTAATEQAEAEFMVRRIEELLGGISHFSINSGRGGETSNDLAFGDIAVLYRNSSQAAPLAEALSRRGIPFHLVGGRPYFMYPGLRAASYFVRAAAGGNAGEHLALLREIRGIGRITLDRLEKEIPLNCPAFFTQAAPLALASDIRTRLQAVQGAIRRFRERTREAGLAGALRQSMLYLALDPEQPEAKQLLELAGAFGEDLPGFAHHLEQNAAATIYDRRAEAVTLMTLHAAKGLEFPVVFLSGLEEGLLPCDLESRRGDLEEERRLFYVGLTRARRILILTAAASRTLHGRNRRQQLSRFLQEIPPHLLARAADKPRPRRSSRAAQMKLF
jgi:DNA helicase II / ATP-dependent DNA helicase PcrA